MGAGAANGNTRVRFTDDEFAKFLVQQCEQRNVLNDSQWAAAIDQMNDVQFLLYLRAKEKKIIKVG